MEINLTGANIKQINVASGKATMNVFNSEKMADKSFEFNKAVSDVEEAIKVLPTKEQETVKNEIETLKGEVEKTNPDGSIVRTSLSVLDNIVNTISNAPNAAKTIAGLIMIAKTFFGF